MEAKDDAPMSPSAQAKVESGRRDIMEKVMQFAMSENFEKDFEDFALEHKKEFLKILVMDLNDTHPMEWHETYLEYLHTFEGKIERFIKSAGFEVNDFYEECKVILETDDEDELSIPIPIETKFFLEALLATSEYPMFIHLMKGEMMQFKNELDLEIATAAPGPVSSSSASAAKTETNDSCDSKGGNDDKDIGDDSK